MSETKAVRIAGVKYVGDYTLRNVAMSDLRGRSRTPGRRSESILSASAAAKG
jgi:hypothetical protein